MASTTFVATTADGATVVRTSSSREYVFVCMGTRDGQAEGAISWHGDKANADKAASTWSSRGMKTRVIPVEQVLHGAKAKAAIEAAKNGTTDVAVTPPAAPSVPVEPVKAKAGATTRRTRTKAAQAPTAAPAAEVDPKVQAAEERARMEALATAEFAALINDLTEAQETVARLLARRNGMIDNLLTQQTVSGPKLAKVMGVTPMAVYNMRAKAVR